MNKFVFAATSILAVAFAFSAQAQRAPKAPAEITVTNARSVPLIGLTLAAQDGTAVAALKSLGPGKSTKLKLKKGSPCELAVAATFDDENDGAGGEINVCADKTLRLTD